MTFPMPQPMPQPMTQPQQPRPMQAPAGMMQPAQPVPMQQPVPAGRQPSTPTDPSNSGAAATSTALPNALTNIVSALKAIQNGLSQCASKAEINELRGLLLGACRTQNAILVLLMRLSEPHIGLPMDAMARMIDTALKDGEPEKWFENLGDGLGKG